MMNNEMKKRIELGVNTKKVKVQFNTSTPSFREIVGNYWVAVVELADMTKVYANNVKILSESVASLTEKAEKKGLSNLETQRLELDSAQLEDYNKKFKVFRDEMNTRFEKCYALITKDLYPAYNAYARIQDNASFEVALRVFFSAHNIENTKSLTDFMLSVIGLRKAPANTKVKSKGTTLLIAQTEKTFNELFMHALAQLMVDKNCIKPEQYTFTYDKASSAHIQSKLDDIVVPEEDTKEESAPVEEKSEPTPDTTVPVEEDSEYANMTVVELRKIAKDKGVKGYSKMKKDELVTILAVALAE